MNNQQFFPHISSADELINALAGVDCSRVMLFTGKRSYESSGAKTVMDKAMTAFCSAVLHVSDFEENPKYADVQKCLAQATDFKPTAFIAVGGGSVIDMAKLVRYYYSGEGLNGIATLVAIPTTSGTGCETTRFAVMYKDGVKTSVDAPTIRPDVAILFPALTYHNPQYLTACTGFDALAQAVEAFWNVNACAESDEYALRALNLVCSSLKNISSSENAEARDNLSLGAYWAGRAINIARTTAPHAYSYAFTSKYGLPHGHAVAVTFPFFYRLYLQKGDTKRADTLLSILGSDIEKYISNIGLSLDLAEKNIALPTILSSCNAERLKNYPIPFEKEDLERYMEDLKWNIKETM